MTMQTLVAHRPPLSSAAASDGLSRRPVQPPWLSVVPHLDPKYGGLSSAVPALASAAALAGPHPVSLAAFCLEGEHFRPAVPGSVDLHYLPLARSAWLRDRSSRQRLRRLVAASAGVHIHGLWEMSTFAAAHVARTAGKPYVISAHGMLESWALEHKKFKKSVYAALFERANLRGAACLHALTEAEANDYRRFGLTNPIAVIPNGVTLPPAASRDLFDERYPALRGKRVILFLSRLHAKKGLDLLSDAWAALSRRWPEAHLVLAGPDFENTRARIAGRLNALGIEDRVTFTGMLEGNAKWSALAAADCFVLPSYSEGLSVSVLEAMGMGIPVVITEQCNLPEAGSHHCGWVIRPEAQALEAALETVLSLPARERQAAGENGRRLVAARYSWPIIGRQMSSLYEWLAGGARPSEFPIRPAVTR